MYTMYTLFAMTKVNESYVIYNIFVWISLIVVAHFEWASKNKWMRTHYAIVCYFFRQQQPHHHMLSASSAFFRQPMNNVQWLYWQLCRWTQCACLLSVWMYCSCMCVCACACACVHTFFSFCSLFVYPYNYKASIE